MSLLYNLVGLIFAVAFLILLFLIAWYIAVPVLIIAFFVWVFKQFTLSVSNKPHILKRRQSKHKQTDKVIDVEWTEV